MCDKCPEVEMVITRIASQADKIGDEFCEGEIRLRIIRFIPVQDGMRMAVCKVLPESTEG